MYSPWKKDFPALADTQLTYLDSAATCQVPRSVIKAVCDYLSSGQGNAGRGMHGLSENASQRIARCRSSIAEFIGCQASQVIFTKGTTEAINLVAASLRHTLQSQHSILVTSLEHHSNLLPWRRLCDQTGATLNVLKVDAQGIYDSDQLDRYLQQDCQLFAMTHCSNVLGTHPDIKQLVNYAQNYQVKTLIDGAQAVSHTALNLHNIGCDYYAFSGHKLYAPGGSGVLYCKDHQSLQPLLLGGGIVNRTSFEQYSLVDSGNRLEAGSANLVALVGLASAIDYLREAEPLKIHEYQQSLIKYLYCQLKASKNYRVISDPASQSLVSFYHPTIHCHDIAALLSERNIAVRAGHHCAQPCLEAIGVKHCVRASIGMYNDHQDVDHLIAGLVEVEKILG